MTDGIPKEAFAMIIGAMKCGTSSLYNYLKNHPEICPCKNKEPEYFSEKQAHGEKIADYVDLWDFNGVIHKYALEASTGYTKYPLEKNVPKNIFNYGISPKFIYIIRNPFDRISSHYNFKKDDISWDLAIDNRHLIDTTNYFLQIERYRKYFPIDDILLLDFDELKENPYKILKRIYGFLKISDSYFPEQYGIKNPTRIKSSLEKRINETKLNVISDFMPASMKLRLKEVIRWWSPPEKRGLTNEEKEIIYSELKDDMRNLSQSYGFNVGKWGFED